MSKDAVLPTASAWGDWLAEQERIALQVYEIKPEQLIADQCREQNISRDYMGREILELLQNAADAAKKANQRGRVRIELSPTGLLVANTGAVFTTGGVKSLQTADLSPKRSKNSKLIGSKGLGFRSVLNWSRHPIILSGDLQLAYNSRYAQALIENLATRSSAVGSVFQGINDTGDSPVPLLPFPVHISTADSRAYIDDAELLVRCEALKAEGYDTVIAMPFDREHSFDHAQQQLQQLRPEFLLFSEGIEKLSVKIELDNSTLSHKTWHLLLEDDEAVALSEQDHNTGSESSQRWRLFSDRGDIPQALLRDSDDPDKYHLVVAFQDEGLAQPDNLYSFFPTSIALPLHALCHATLELEQNRKHLQEGAANTFVLKRLAEFLAEKFEQQTMISGDIFRAIDLLVPKSLLQDYQEDIKSLQLALIEAIKLRNILPTISGSRISANEALSFPSRVSDVSWLPKAIFPSVLVARESIDKQLFDLLGVETINAEGFISLLQAAVHLTLEQRASLALGIINQRLGAGFCYQGLLLDTEGEPLQEDDSVYLPGGSLGEGLVFPAWAKVKILNEPLWALLRSQRTRESAKALSIFGVQKYALGALIAGLVSAANAAVENQDENTVRDALLSSLYQLYSRYDNSEERPDFPKNLTAIVVNKVDEWVPANSAYFGDGYSQKGEIVSGLYATFPEKLIANSSRYLALGIDESQLLGFLSWLGVAEWPRLVRRKKVEPEFKVYALPKLDYPVIFSESDSHRFDSHDELPYDCGFQYVRSLDGIDAILSAESSVILAWLAKDFRAASWLQADSENGRLSFVPPGCQNERSYKGELVSYIHWKIKTSCWLSSADGKLLAPVDSMINDSGVAGIFPKPLPLSKLIFEKYSLTSELLRLAWLNAGVRSGVEELDSEEIYGILTELPARDPSGKLVKKLYNWLIKSVDFLLDEQGEQYKAFIEGGEIYATQGDQQGYFPVREAYHVDVEGFPQEFLRSLPVVGLPKKRGADKVKRLFGINVLDKKAVNETIIEYSVAACTERANQHFQDAKRYIEIYRRSRFAKAVGYSIFERLQLRVCESIQSQITFKQETLDNQLPAWTYSIQDDFLYVCCDLLQANEPYHSLLADTIGEAIAAVFGLNDGDPFSKLYQCDELSRLKLLSKMVGDELDDDLDAQLQQLRDESIEQTMPEPVVTMGPVPTAPVSPPESSTTPSVSTSAPTEPKVGGWNVPGAVTAKPVKHVPQEPSKSIAKRVNGGGGGSSAGSTTPKSDGRAGEELARLFEESQGRFPLEVWHITGSETISADILSFRSDEDRELFKSGEDQRAELVERVIEAKEKWSGGRVNLTTNEVNAAAQWKDKYYIYRFKPIDATAAEYELKVLKNPLSHFEAVVSSIDISLDIASTSQQFRVSGIDTE